MRSTLFVRRALGPLRTHSSSFLRKCCRLRSTSSSARGALGLGEQEIAVVALVREEAAARELDDARGDAIEEIAVVRDEEAGAGIARKEVLQPLDRFGVEVVGRLVEDEEIGPGEQRAAERDAALFAAAERADQAIARGRMEIRGERFHALIEHPAIEMLDVIEQLRGARALRRRVFVFVE